jgi:tetraacyldisaccharide 4'-kinase
MKRLEYYWYTRSPWLILLTPVSLVFRIVVGLRKLAYRLSLLPGHKIAVPVIVVGNLTVGGTGKTPLVAWMAGYLKEKGYRPGIISRGYRGKARSWPQQVRPDSDPKMVGDEAVLLAGISKCPMAVGPDRVATANALIAHSDCDVIISDDGLQHYALKRDIEIAVIDGVRRFGTGFMMPAGPLREPLKRLKEVDLVVVNGLGGGSEHNMKVKPGAAQSLGNADKSKALADFRGQTVHAVAGIGNPERFFRSLRQNGINLEEHPFQDHHLYKEEDISFADNKPVIMTEKDAVKCRHFPMENAWFVPVNIEMTSEFCERFDELLDQRIASQSIHGGT